MVKFNRLLNSSGDLSDRLISYLVIIFIMKYYTVKNAVLNEITPV